MNLITLEEYKAAKQLTADTKNDVRIGFLIESVSSLIKAYINVNLTTGGETVTESIMLDYDTDIIFLQNYPISSITSVTEASPRYTTGATVHVPLTGTVDYIENLKDGTIQRVVNGSGFGNWPISPGLVTIEYVTAPTWATINLVPSDLKLAAIQLIDYYKDEEYRQSKSVQGSSIVNTLPQGEDFPKHIQVILDRYK